MGLRDTLGRILSNKRSRQAPPSRAKARGAVRLVVPPLQDFRIHTGSVAKEENVAEAVKEMPRPSSPASTFQRPNVSQKGNDRGLRTMHFQSAHYDLVELARARDTESLINSSVERHVETALRKGFKWKSDNEEVMGYLKQRQLEISSVSKLTFRKVLEQIFDQLATYGTAFLVVKRDKKRSSGKKVRMFGRTMEPIAAWGVPDSATMSVAENESGNIRGWKQEINEAGMYRSSSSQKEKFFPHNDVFVFTRHKQAGRVFGRSPYLSTLDDAIMLRELEELVYIISQKHAFPIFQYIVGTDEHPATDVVLPNGEIISEIELAQSTVENMPVEGGFVTPERHEIKLIGTEGKVLDLMPYIEHFKTRVQDSTRMSNAALGTGNSGDSKSTAQSQMKNMEDSAGYLQDVVSDGFHWFIVMLLGEGGYDINLDNMAELDFSAPDTEETRAQENHVLAQFQGDAINCDELRASLGRECFTEEEKKTTSSEQSHMRDKELATMAAAQKAASQASSGTTASKGTTKQKTKPTNQSGTKSTKTKVKKNDYVTEIESVWKDARAAAMKHRPIKDEHSLGYNRATSPYVDQMASLSKRYLGAAIEEGLAQARVSNNDACLFVSLNQRKRIFHTIRQTYKKHMNDTVGNGFNGGSNVFVNAAFGSGNRKLTETAEAQVDFSRRAAFMAATNNSGVAKVKISDKDRGYGVEIDSSDYCSKILSTLHGEYTIEAVQ